MDIRTRPFPLNHMGIEELPAEGGEVQGGGGGGEEAGGEGDGGGEMSNSQLKVGFDFFLSLKENIYKKLIPRNKFKFTKEICFHIEERTKCKN